MKPVAIPVPVEIYAGDDVTFPRFQLKNETNDPIDLSSYTNWEASWRARASDTTSLPLIVDSTDAATGWIALSASADVTREMPSKGVWDVQAVSAAGKIQTFLYGTTKWRGDVTRG